MSVRIAGRRLPIWPAPVIIGVGMVAVALLADIVSAGSQAGLGRKQIALIEVGAITIAIGIMRSPLFAGRLLSQYQQDGDAHDRPLGLLPLALFFGLVVQFLWFFVGIFFVNIVLKLGIQRFSAVGN